MSFKEVKELRKAGKLEEANSKATQDLEANPADIWNKRSMSWVLYEFLKLNADSAHFENFHNHLNDLKSLNLPGEETMLYENVAWQVVKVVFDVTAQPQPDFQKAHLLFDTIKDIPLTKNSSPYSVLLKAFLKFSKTWPRIKEFIEWWDLDNLRPEDYLSEQSKDGKEMMALAEQAYIAYARILNEGELIKRKDGPAERSFDNTQIRAFLPKLEKLTTENPKYLYPPYYLAKLMMKTGDREHALKALIPFARKKQNEFWIWEIMAELNQDDPESQFACYCKALSVNAPDKFLNKVREPFAEILMKKELFDEAKTEIKLIAKTCVENKWPSPVIVIKYHNHEGYKNAKTLDSNHALYNLYASKAEELLYHDIDPVIGVIEFVNKDKQVVNFIVNKEVHGFFKYTNFLSKPEIGEFLKLRLDKTADGSFRVLTAKKTDTAPSSEIFIEFQGTIDIRQGNEFGFVNDIFITPEMIKTCGLQANDQIIGIAIISYNRKKGAWGWKAISCIKK